MQVAPHTTAVALHPDVLQQHPLMLIPPTMHELLEGDATPALWVIALSISITLRVLLVVLQKSGRSHVSALQLPLLCHC